MTRFGLGLAVLFIVAVIHIDFWKKMAPLAYLGAMGLLVAVEFVGVVGMGAQRWIDIGPLRLQPSEVMKIALVMVLALTLVMVFPQIALWLPEYVYNR